MGGGINSKQDCFSIGWFANLMSWVKHGSSLPKNLEMEENVVFPILNLFTINGSLKYLIYLCFEKET